MSRWTCKIRGWLRTVEAPPVVRSHACLSGMPACLALLGSVFWLSQRCDPFGASITALSRHACSRSPGGRQELRQCDGGFSVFVRPELALRLAQLGDDGQLLLTTATGQLLV